MVLVMARAKRLRRLIGHLPQGLDTEGVCLET
jgi:hypothetical protein